MFITTSACSQRYKINLQDVQADISYLASDELKGRAVFTPEIDTAANYIAKEFSKAGLKPIGDNNSFKQTFSLNRLKTDKVELQVNNQSVDSENIFIGWGDEELSWTEVSDIIVTYIRKEDDFDEEMQRIGRNDDNLLVVVDPAHESSFKRYQGYYSRGTNVMRLGEGRSVVYALTDVRSIETYALEALAVKTENSLTNVVGSLPGKRPDEFVLFSAHYDHIGIRRAVNGDSIANGANDDASGVAAVLSLARYFAAGPTPERTLIFAAFTAEERGGYGSRYFSQSVNPDEIIAMFNIEMIGKPATEGPNTAWITGWDKSDFGELLQQSAEGSIYTFYPDPYPAQNLFYRSDNATLARLGVPAHSISTTPIDVDKDYHQVTDQVETLDLEHLTNTIKAIAVGANQFVNGEVTPRRVDPNES